MWEITLISIKESETSTQVLHKTRKVSEDSFSENK